MPEDRLGLAGGRGGRPLSRAISSLRSWFSARSAWFSVRRAPMETVSVESSGHADIQSVNHKTARKRKQLSPEIRPAYLPDYRKHCSRGFSNRPIKLRSLGHLAPYSPATFL